MADVTLAEVTYYFNSRSTGNWADPDNMIDGILTNYASTSSKDTTETLDGNTCPGDDLGPISKVEIRCYGYGDGDDKITLNGVALTMPSVADWSSYVDVGITTWAEVVALAAIVQFTAVGKANIMRCAKVEIRVSYWSLPLSDIDIGADPICRGYWGDAEFTYIDLDNPANAGGTLHSVQVVPRIEGIAGLIVGTFYITNGNTFKCRDSVFLGDVTAEYGELFEGLSIAVEEGDYIGCYFTSGRIECDFSGFAGVWHAEGKHINPNDETTYFSYPGYAISVYGYGDFGPPPAYYHGLKVQGEGELALCDVGSHPLRIRKGGTTYGIELVDTSDPNASRIRVETLAGVKAIRKYT